MNLLLPEQIDHYWPNLSGWLLATPHIWEGWCLEDIYDQLKTGELRAWALWDADGIKVVVVTRTVQRPTRRILWVQFAFGRGLEQFLPLAREGFSRVATLLECDMVMLSGRRGWVRKLASAGWKEDSVNMSFDVKTPNGESLN